MSSTQNAAMKRHNYYSDSRVIEGMRGKAFVVVAEGPDVTVIVPHECLTDPYNEDEDGEQFVLEARYEVRTRYEVCPTCAGSAKVVNPSVDAGGISRDDFDADPDFKCDYFDGRFDITCPECNGKRVTLDPNAAMESLPKEVRKRLLDFQKDLDYDLNEWLSELRMGC